MSWNYYKAQKQLLAMYWRGDIDADSYETMYDLLSQVLQIHIKID